MNKKAQSLGIVLAVVVAIMIFIVGMVNLNFIKDEVTRARGSTELNCADPQSDGTKLTCLAVDLVVPYFIIVIFSLAGGVITARLLI